MADTYAGQDLVGPALGRIPPITPQGKGVPGGTAARGEAE